MTISYAKDISNGSGLKPFLKVLVRWRGSLYRLVYIDLIGYLVIYYVINFIYRFALQTQNQKRIFVKIVMYCDHLKGNIPLSFLLGFFVAGVMLRWFKMFLYIPRLDKMSFLIQGFVCGGDLEMSKKVRQTAMRFLNLSWILCMKELSDQINERFRKNLHSKEYDVRKTFTNINQDKKVQATYRKMITDAEVRTFEGITTQCEVKYKRKYVPEFWIPIQWTSRLLQKAFIHGLISDSQSLSSLINDLDHLRKDMHILQLSNAIMIPLVYTQVITIAVYSFFLCEIFAAQFIDPANEIEGHEIDMYIPVFSVFQFLFYMGWLKVALAVINPFGDDDEDFPTSDILDEHLDVTLRSVTAESYMYPEYLDSPRMYFNPQEGSNEDFLRKFLEEVEDDLEETEVTNIDISAMEVKTDRCTIFMKKVTSGFCKCFHRKSPLSKGSDNSLPITQLSPPSRHFSLFSEQRMGSSLNSSSDELPKKRKSLFSLKII